MRFYWEKKGLIFDPTDRFEWMHAYAQVPTAIELADSLRIFFTCRPKPDANGQQISYVSFIDVAKQNPLQVLYIHDKPVLDLGKPGTFDEFGTHPCCFTNNNDELYFYYQGWTRSTTVPYSTSLGLALSDGSALKFRKFSEGPLFGRSYLDPYLENGFFVYKEDGKQYLFYASCKEWLHINNKAEPVYKIVHATSKNGIDWSRDGNELFEPKSKFEASGRPSVIKIGDIYHMWFCYRNVMTFRDASDGTYRIGYAYSTDLTKWTREDQKSGISISEKGWDSEMIAYPFVCKVLSKYYMFYNGNFFGKGGFGYAELNTNCLHEQ